MSDCVYLTHPEVAVDPSVPVPDWSLSARGRERAQAGLRQPFLTSIRHVFSSAERKAVETAGIFAGHLGLEVIVDPLMHENDRSATGFLPPDEFETVADAFFAVPGASVRGWETARDAQRRVVERVTTALNGIHPGDGVLFVGHGAVGTLLKCHLAALEIDRRHDQPAGGGHFYFFDRAMLIRPRVADLLWQRIDDIAAFPSSSSPIG
ncbi:histidine phosphatase family protein [Stappia sp. F7233]|uniref:Histidine phosphatase family protein n=1 Tax=Stappia albiluteola TaxID=2758565 RepID=A0A839AAG7_9HYPH|nr:histidine phosphatase family protein [Stappia albiluteola]MBA5776115.1 histidine phosphatase family protein [Stappia albiluteola]